MGGEGFGGATSSQLLEGIFQSRFKRTGAIVPAQFLIQHLHPPDQVAVGQCVRAVGVHGQMRGRKLAPHRLQKTDVMARLHLQLDPLVALLQMRRAGLFVDVLGPLLVVLGMNVLGFVLGGAPGAPGRETFDAATGAAIAVGSQLVASFITGKLPIPLDVINYEPTTSSSSGAFVLGRWVTSKLLVLYRNRVEAKTDENANEVEAEYWLKRSVLIEGSYGDHSVLGLDLLWNKRW